MNISTLSNALVNIREQLWLADSDIPPLRKKCWSQASLPGSLPPCAETLAGEDGITRLLAEALTYDPKCVIVIEKRLPLDRTFPVEQNEYILVMDGAELALQCVGHMEQTIVVAVKDSAPSDE